MIPLHNQLSREKFKQITLEPGGEKLAAPPASLSFSTLHKTVSPP